MRQSSVYFRNDHHLAATQCFPEAEIHPIMQLAHSLYHVSRKLILNRYASKWKMHVLIFKTYCLCISAYLILSFGCDLYLQFRDTVEIPQSYKVTHFCLSALVLEDQTVTNQDPSRFSGGKCRFICMLSLTNLLEFEIYFTDDFSHKSRLTTNITWHYLLFYP